MKLLGKGNSADSLIAEFKPENVVAAYTSEHGYEGEKHVLFTKGGEYFLFVGWHCSCNWYDNNTDWDITILENEKEVKSLISGWKENGDEEEKIFAESIARSLNQYI